MSEKNLFSLSIKIMFFNNHSVSFYIVFDCTHRQHLNKPKVNFDRCLSQKQKHSPLQSIHDLLCFIILCTVYHVPFECSVYCNTCPVLSLCVNNRFKQK